MSGLAAFRELEAMGSRIEHAPPKEGPLVLRMRLKSEANEREHWAVKSKRAQDQRAAVAVAWHFARWPQGKKPAAVALVRVIGPRGRDFDGDNLQRAFKAIRDEVAAIGHFDDGDRSVAWRYEQERGETWAVRIEVAWP